MQTEKELTPVQEDLSEILKEAQKTNTEVCKIHGKRGVHGIFVSKLGRNYDEERLLCDYAGNSIDGLDFFCIDCLERLLELATNNKKEHQQKKITSSENEIMSGNFMCGSIPKRFKLACMDDFNINQSYNGEDSVLIYGGCGTGKTHLSVAMAKQWFLKINMSEKREFPKNSQFVNFQDITISVKSSFRKESSSMSEIIEDHKNDFRIFDDICSSKPTETAIEALYSIVNARYDEMIPTIYTTNLSLSEISSFYGDRIASRLASCRRIELKGEDKRLKAKNSVYKKEIGEME